MKWGVRRYQNKDGTLTAAGKKHYAGDENAGEGATAKTEYAPKRKGGKAEDYSDEELRARINRLQMEKAVPRPAGGYQHPRGRPEPGTESGEKNGCSCRRT